MATVNFGGLASGLDTEALVRAVLDFESRPLDRLQSRRSVFDQQRAALTELEEKLGTFGSALRDLSNPTNFRSRLSTVSDESVLRASVGSTAELGLFSIDVQELAAASKVKSDGFADADQSLISDGTITLQSGEQELITIDVDAASGNNTLEQVRDAINSADAGVQASIIFDGTDYRLTARSVDTGTANALVITDGTNLNLDDTVNNEVIEAADARIELDGIEITSSSNRITEVIPGVTLDLVTTTAVGSPITLEISKDNDKIVENVQQLTETYNDLLGFFNDQFDRNDPGPLNNEVTARSIQQQVQILFSAGVEGLPFGSIRSLSAVGVDFDGRTGEATLDSEELRSVLDTNFEEVGNLFLTGGVASDARVSFVSSTSETEPGVYALEITAPAETAAVEGSRSISRLNADETLTVTVGTESIDVDLFRLDRINDVVGRLNTAFTGAGFEATARNVNGVLRIAGSTFGSAAEISVLSDRVDPGNGRGSGFTTTTTTGFGVDIAGSIGGVAATGNGQVLTAATGEAFGGLQIRSTATQEIITAQSNDFGTISFTKGLVPAALETIESFTRLGDSPISRAEELLTSRIDQIGEDITRIEERLALRETQLLRAFTEAETAIQTLQAQQQAFSAV